MGRRLHGKYQEAIIDHARHPRNSRSIDGATRTAEAVNPLCGDQLRLYLEFAGGTVADIAFECKGCAIFQASDSLMTKAMRGLQREAALALLPRVHTILTIEFEGDASTAEVGKFAVLSVFGSTRHGTSVPPWPGWRCAAP